jgi:hypothetical protein
MTRIAVSSSSRRDAARLAFVTFLLAIQTLGSACGAAEINREQAARIISEQLAKTGTVTRDIPIGNGLHAAVSGSSAADFGAPVRNDMYKLIRELERRNLVTVVDRGPLEGWGGQVRTFDVSLTAEGAKVLGALQSGRTDYGRGASAYPLPKTFVQVTICRRAVSAVTGIRILKAGVEVQVEYDWECKIESDLAGMVAATKMSYGLLGMGQEKDVSSHGKGTAHLALYDDGWRLIEAP